MRPAKAEDGTGTGWNGNGRLSVTLQKRDGIALIVSNVVGVGIFTTPAVIASLVPSPLAMLSLWLVGGMLALAGALCYARLAKLWPTAGGEYVYVSRIYGPAAGFLSGWTSLIAGFSGSVAANAIAVVLFAGQYFPNLASDQVLASQDFLGITVTLSSRKLVAALLIALFAALHMCNLTAGRITQRTLAVVLITILAILVGYGFATGHGSWSHFQSAGLLFGPMNWLLALIPVMFTYSGWNAAAYVAEEIHASQRSIRPILLGGTAIVIVLYLVLNTFYLYAVPLGAMRGSSNVAQTAARSLLGAESHLITPALIVAILGAISAMTIAGPRVYFAMARDGRFIPALARINPRFQTPARAIALQALWSITLVLIGGFQHILMYTGFAIVLSSGAAVAGLFFVRKRESEAWSRLVLPAVFVLASGAMVIDMVWSAPRIALTGILLIAAGLPAYLVSVRSRTARCTLQAQEAAGD